jgi:hypothetical protein
LIVLRLYELVTASSAQRNHLPRGSLFIYSDRIVTTQSRHRHMGMRALEPADHFYNPTNESALRCYDFTTSNVFFTLIFVSVRDFKVAESALGIEEQKVHLDASSH